jgi:hypothetical protein
MGRFISKIDFVSIWKMLIINSIQRAVFPASKLSVDPRSGVKQRHHLDESAVQKAVKQAIRKAGIKKHASCHTFTP